MKSDKVKKDYKLIGFGLILGVSTWFWVGLIISNPTYAPVFWWIGAGIWIIITSIITKKLK